MATSPSACEHQPLRSAPSPAPRRARPSPAAGHTGKCSSGGRRPAPPPAACARREVVAGPAAAEGLPNPPANPVTLGSDRRGQFH